MKEVTAMSIAIANGTEYIPVVKFKEKSSSEQYVNALYALDNKYILMVPPNTGRPTCPFDWYIVHKGKPRLILTNQTSFHTIKNLDEILMQITKLYERYIDENVFISWKGFVLRLTSNPIYLSGYEGNAVLVLTDEVLCNNYVNPNNYVEAKKHLLNEFLDHFIGWNFGVVIKKNPELEKALLDFNELVISKGLREDAGPGLRVWQSEFVQPYNFKKA